MTLRPQFTTEWSNYTEAKSKCVSDTIHDKSNYYFDNKNLDGTYMKTEQNNMLPLLKLAQN